MSTDSRSPINNLPLLKVESLAITHQNGKVKKNIVRDITFELGRGEILGVLGASGAGKSLTALSLMGLLGPDFEVTAEQLLLNGEDHPVDLLQLNEKRWRYLRGKQIAMVFQDPKMSLDPVYTCGNQVKEGLLKIDGIANSEADQKAKELFDSFNLDTSILSKLPAQISGGEAQRVMMVMAMMRQPKILIADEPTSSLDGLTRQEIIKVFQQLRAENGTSIIFISHDRRQMKRLADRVLMLEDGASRLVSTISNPKLFTHSTHRAHVAGESEPVLQVDELSIAYQQDSWFNSDKGRQLAVDNVSFQLADGEALGIVGETGSGKSSIAKALTGLIEPQSGSIRFWGKELIGMNSPARRDLHKSLQMIFQDPYSSLNPRKRIGRAVGEPLRTLMKLPAQTARKKVLTLLEMVGLSGDYYDRYPHQLSGGERQRVCIARALAVSPKLLICDEPVSSLDYEVQGKVLELFQSLRTDLNLSLIFISHDLSVINFIADNTLILHEGKIVERGPTKELFNKPQHAYTQRLLAANPNH